MQISEVLFNLNISANIFSMDIAKYLEEENMTQAQFAELVSATQGAVSHWVTKRCPVSPRRAKIIEKATNGKVTMKDLCPDLFGDAA